MEANEIASASRFGWGTVKYYENYSVFKVFMYLLS